MFDWILNHHKHRGSPTVRFAFPAMVLFLTALGAAVISATEESYVRVEATPTYVGAGETFEIAIYASASTPTNAIDLQVRYPDDQIEVTGIDVGESVITIWTEEPYAEAGVLYFRGGVFRKGFLGEHLVAVVNAKAVESGTARIVASEATFLAGDGKGTEVEVTETGGETANVRISSAGTLESELAIGLVTDLNGDGEVDLEDIKAFMHAWRTKGGLFDFNHDGRMTFRDFGILLAQAFFK